MDNPYGAGAAVVKDAPRQGDPLEHQIADEPAAQPIVRDRPGVNDASAPTDEAIARRAYELFLARGRGDGHDMEDWFQAERELRAGPEISGGREISGHADISGSREIAGDPDFGGDAGIGGDPEMSDDTARPIDTERPTD